MTVGGGLGLTPKGSKPPRRLKLRDYVIFVLLWAIIAGVIIVTTVLVVK